MSAETNVRPITRFVNVPRENRGGLFDCDAVLYPRQYEKFYQRRIWSAALATKLERSLTDEDWEKVKGSLSTPGAWPEHLEKILQALKEVFDSPSTEFAMKSALLEAIETHAVPVSGFAAHQRIPEILQCFAGAGIAKRGVVTSAFRPYTERILSMAKLQPFFPEHTVVAAEDVQRAAKEHPLPEIQHGFKPGPFPWVYTLTRRLGGSRLDHIDVFEDNPRNGAFAVASMPNSRGWIITRDGKSVSETWDAIVALTVTESLAESVTGLGYRWDPAQPLPESVLNRIHVADSWETAHEIIRDELAA
jgi:beta-phosphoglucomutase-like phosphatase (HAD superfamily)